MEKETKKEIENYVRSTLALEDQFLTDEEWNKLIKAVEENHDQSLLEEIVKSVRRKNSGKTK